ncbi:MAG: hypothetical protein MRY74_11875 [Neomegalonema sp.]|nr:hypothetical protein [Neomegalonema sp.]
MSRLILTMALLVGAVMAAWLMSEPLVAWASLQQRALQGDLAAALLAVRSGDLLAVGTMIGLCAAYGVIHAVGPGHGKMLIGGAAVASRRTAWRMAALGVAASLAQGLTAILLVYGGLGLFSVTSRTLIGLSDTWLTAASYGAIGAIGGLLAVRGGRLALRLPHPRLTASSKAGHDHHHHHEGEGCAAGCRHGPTAQEVNRIESWRDALVLTLSIGMRPCSGALIVLALSWRFETYLVGALSVAAMALGTGLVVASVALIAVKLRDSGRLADATPLSQWGFAVTQLSVGAAILVVSVVLAIAALDPIGASHPLMGGAG